MSESPLTVVRRTARDAVAQMRAVIEQGADPLTVTKALLDGAAEGTRIVPALREALHSDDLISRTVAALHLSLLRRSPAYSISEEVMAEVCTVYLDGLQNSTREVRLMTCLLMSSGPIPDAVVPTLNRLQDDPDESMRAFVAAAMSQLKVCDPKVLSILRDALHRDCASPDDFILVRTAAVAMGRLGVASRDAATTMIKSFDKATPTMKHALLLGLKELGPAAAAAIDSVSAILIDRSVPRDVRGIAAVTLGSITHGTNSAHATFEMVLRTSQVELRAAVLSAIIECRTRSDGLISAILPLLGDDAQILRMWSAMALIGAEPYAGQALPALLERLGVESDQQTLSFVTDAIESIAEIALPKLIELVSQSMGARLEAIMECFCKIGTKAVGAIIVELERQYTKQLAGSLVATVDRMEGDKTMAVGGIGRLLNTTADEETALALVVAIALAGPASINAAEPLTKWLIQGTDEVAVWAARALVNAGPSVLKEVNGAIASCPRDRRERLIAVRDCFAAPAAQVDPYGKFRTFDNDMAIRTFVYAARFLDRVKRKASMGEIVGELQQMSKLGEIKGKFACKKRTVEMRLREFEQYFHVSLRDCVPGAKGALSSAAAQILPDLEQYLLTLPI